MIDPYFSGTKVVWLNENDTDVHTAIESGEAYFGNVDSWLLYKLTNGSSYLTDYSNASRTMFFNLSELKWDREILKMFGLNKLNLPDPLPSNSNFGSTNFNGLLDHSIPITGMIGDSHAAAFGERCFDPGSVKITMGTGSSILMNTGEAIIKKCEGMVTTICWSTKESVEYALEGIIVSCGATMNWMQDSLELFEDPKEADQLAESLDSNGGVYIIPAFSGLGAPFWKMGMKAQILGLTYGSTKREVIRAGLESIPFQIAAIMKSISENSGIELKTVKLDGGLTSSKLVRDYIASLLEVPVERVLMKEASALGAALLAGLGCGVYNSISELRQLGYEKETIKPKENDVITKSYKDWLSIITSLSE